MEGSPTRKAFLASLQDTSSRQVSNGREKYKDWDVAEFANVNLSMNTAVPRRLAQRYVTEVGVRPEKIEFPSEVRVRANERNV